MLHKMYSQILIVAKEVSDLIKEVPAPIWGGGGHPGS